MKKLLLSVATLTLLFGACKKNESNNGLGNNQFKIGSTTYSDVYLSSSFGLKAVSPTGGSLQMRFYEDLLPATGGTFKVAVDANASDEVQIIAIGTVNGTSKTYAAGYTSGQTATVTVSNGNYAVKFNDVSARNTTDTTETTLVSANVFEE